MKSDVSAETKPVVEVLLGGVTEPAVLREMVIPLGLTTAASGSLNLKRQRNYLWSTPPPPHVQRESEK